MEIEKKKCKIFCVNMRKREISLKINMCSLVGQRS